MKAKNQTQGRATTLKQATAIAKAGANKMTEAGYTYRRHAMSNVSGTVFTPAGTRYEVRSAEEDGMLPACNCGYYNENKEFRTCKHIVWVAEQLGSENALEAEMEAGSDYPFLMSEAEACALDTLEREAMINKYEKP
jgi:hypothetical protein